MGPNQTSSDRIELEKADLIDNILNQNQHSFLFKQYIDLRTDN